MHDNITYATCAVCGIKLKWKYCRVCKEHQAEYYRLQQKKRYEYRAANGLCVRCGAIAIPNNVRCEKHVKENKKHCADYYEAKLKI
ncbi:hypothetical protein SPSPH_046950 (plasmid) [Sporomusa sphaeroides DSM 2875]|uniref:Uncharacterized protein n=1 Tax=Sporomusa sphaeroides DSM 2875 TaxID=1337886 RepID=A0A1U7MA02_9FIRM|nr:hypothetical protein SPSPH_46000 [Sporomusa sphaeroides DSM 2875]CVK21650.1 hypothetical protein SSPH_04345 [Sporomusa sphaeroides DSM 2875]